MWSDLLRCTQLETSSLTLSSGHWLKHMVSSKQLRWWLSDLVSPATRDASSLVQPRDLLLSLTELLGWDITCVPAPLSRSKLSLQWNLLISHWAGFLLAAIYSLSASGFPGWRGPAHGEHPAALRKGCTYQRALGSRDELQHLLTGQL